MAHNDPAQLQDIQASAEVEGASQMIRRMDRKLGEVVHLGSCHEGGMSGSLRPRSLAKIFAVVKVLFQHFHPSQNWSFIDYGAGWCRLMFAALMQNAHYTAGVELRDTFDKHYMLLGRLQREGLLPVDAHLRSNMRTGDASSALFAVKHLLPAGPGTGVICVGTLDEGFPYQVRQAIYNHACRDLRVKVVFTGNFVGRRADLPGVLTQHGFSHVCDIDGPCQGGQIRLTVSVYRRA